MTRRIVVADRLRARFAIAGLALVAAACGAAVNSSSASAASGPLKEARCMRSHGFPNFPDPTTSPPPVPPPGSHTGNAIGMHGAYLVFPPQSPALKRAIAACGFRIP